MSKEVTIWTDGSCETRTGEGGWAFRLQFGSHIRETSGYEAGTTNNRMELTAAVTALENLTEGCTATIVTDSQYLKNAFTAGWLANWQRNGWKTAGKDPVKNKDLWLRLLEQSDRHELKWKWTKGHAGHTENEIVDTLALRARKSREGSDRRFQLG